MTSVQMCPTLFTAHYFFWKIVEIKRFALLAAILDECQNHLASGVWFGRKRGKYFSRLPFGLRFKPQRPPLGYI